MESEEAARVRALGEILREYDLDAVRIKDGDLEIEVVRRDPAAVASAPVYVAAPGGPGPGPAPAAAPLAPGEAPSVAPGGGPPAGTKTVTAPLVGVFYRASAPGAAPFVEIGQRVSVGQTLCILEAMKLMNEITSDHAGVVTRVLAENGQLVTLGEDLFWIE